MARTDGRWSVAVTSGFLFTALSLAACGSGPARTIGTSTTARSLGEAVSGGRFTRTVQLDNGDLRVQPAPAILQPAIPEGTAAPKIWATAQLANFQAVVVGFGLVTISIRQNGVPVVTMLPAWIGFAKTGAILCPLETGAAPPVLPPSSGLAAVVIGAGDGLPAVVYRARTSECEQPATGPSIAVADELVSLAWTAVTPAANGSLTVRYFQPRCASDESQSENGTPTSTALTIEVQIPDVPEKCVPGRFVETSVSMLPTASSASMVDHGNVGVVREVQAASPAQP